MKRLLALMGFFPLVCSPLFSQADTYTAPEGPRYKQVARRDIPIGGWACLSGGALYFSLENHVWIAPDGLGVEVLRYEPGGCMFGYVHRRGAAIWEVHLLGMINYRGDAHDEELKRLGYTKVSVVIP